MTVDSTLLEGNAALKRLVRRAAGNDCRTSNLGLIKKERRIDADARLRIKEVCDYVRSQFDNSDSNQVWTGLTDAEAKTARMNDSTTELANKENAANVKLGVVLAEVFCSQNRRGYLRATFQDTTRS